METEKETQWVLVHADPTFNHMTMSAYASKKPQYKKYITKMMKLIYFVVK